MARIAGITLPNKRIEIALTYVYGIGRNRAKEILEKVGIDKNTRAADITGAEEKLLRDEIEKNYKVEGELRREQQAMIKRLKDIGSYRGSRHAKGLPARGQRTKTNSRTVRGNVRRTMGSGRTKVEKK
jgi:small subunit ribosomal protein S13